MITRFFYFTLYIIGAASIADALLENESLQILDLSFNPIGNGLKLSKDNSTQVDALKGKKGKKSASAADNFSKMFEKNRKLLHCNFSHCGFSKEECEVMRVGLNQNHTVLGLHMIGNKMNTNALGFLTNDTHNLSAPHMIAAKIENSDSIAKSKEKMNFNITSN